MSFGPTKGDDRVGLYFDMDPPETDDGRRQRRVDIDEDNKIDRSIKNTASIIYQHPDGKSFSGSGIICKWGEDDNIVRFIMTCGHVCCGFEKDYDGTKIPVLYKNHRVY